MSAFDDVIILIDKLSQLENGLNKEEAKCLLRNTKIAHSFMRSHFSYDLELESNSTCHCVLHACSDPNDKHFQKKCSKPHDKNCIHCQNIDDIFVVLNSVINRVSTNGHSKVDCDEMAFDLREAKSAIKNFQYHLE